jgi:hypothetical protein
MHVLNIYINFIVTKYVRLVSQRCCLIIGRLHFNLQSSAFLRALECKLDNLHRQRCLFRLDDQLILVLPDRRIQVLVNFLVRSRWRGVSAARQRDERPDTGARTKGIILLFLYQLAILVRLQLAVHLLLLVSPLVITDNPTAFRLPDTHFGFLWVQPELDE